MVERPEERRERLAGPGGGEDQRVLAARDRGPALLLGGGRDLERAQEPGAYGGGERGERVDGARVPPGCDTRARPARGGIRGSRRWASRRGGSGRRCRR